MYGACIVSGDKGSIWQFDGYQIDLFYALNESFCMTDMDCCTGIKDKIISFRRVMNGAYDTWFIVSLGYQMVGILSLRKCWYWGSSEKIYRGFILVRCECLVSLNLLIFFIGIILGWICYARNKCIMIDCASFPPMWWITMLFEARVNCVVCHATISAYARTSTSSFKRFATSNASSMKIPIGFRCIMLSLVKIMKC